MELLKKIAKQSKTISWANHYDPRFKKLAYVRYADDWIICIKGSLIETKVIHDKIKDFLSSINLILSEDKTKITNVSTEIVNFLGTRIYRAKHTSYVRIRKTSSIKRNPRRLRLDAPIMQIIHKLKNASFMKGGKSYPKFIWMD